MSNCKLTTKILPAACAWMLLIGCTGLFFAFTCPYLIKEYSIGIAVYQSLLTIFVISNFGFSTFMDPGVYPKASNELVKDGDLPVPLHKTVEINNVTVRMKWCTTCKFYRPPRSSHCSMCDCCIEEKVDCGWFVYTAPLSKEFTRIAQFKCLVEVFDHHCPWVNNCVGRRNYRYFFQFLVSLTVHMVSIFAFCLIYVLRHKQELKTVDNIVSMCLMGIIGVLSVPIVGLTCFHIVLIGRGRTTNEQVTGKMRGTENPFNMGCVKNCCYLFCGPTWPGLLRKTRWMTGSKAVKLSTASYNASDSVVKIYMETSYNGPPRNNKEYNKMLQMNSRQAQEVLHHHQPLLHHHLVSEPFEPNSVVHPPPPVSALGFNRGQPSMVPPCHQSSVAAPMYSYPNGGYPLIQSPVGLVPHHGMPVGPQPGAVVVSVQQSHMLHPQQQQFQQQLLPQFQQSFRNHHHQHHHHHPSSLLGGGHSHHVSAKCKSPAAPARAPSRQASASTGGVPNPFKGSLKEAGYCGEGAGRHGGTCLLSSCEDRNSLKAKQQQHHNNFAQQSSRQRAASYDRQLLQQQQQPTYHGKRGIIERNDSDITEYKV